MAKKIKITSKGYAVKVTSKSYQKVDPHILAEALGADVMESLNLKGLEVIFIRHLHKNLNGLSPGGAIFPFECLAGYDMKNGKIVLTEDYEVWKNLNSNTFFFRSADKNRPMMFVHKRMLVSIRDLSSDKVLYQK